MPCTAIPFGHITTSRCANCATIHPTIRPIQPSPKPRTQPVPHPHNDDGRKSRRNAGETPQLDTARSPARRREPWSGAPVTHKCIRPVAVLRVRDRIGDETLAQNRAEPLCCDDRIRPGGGARRAAAGRSLRDESDHSGTPVGVIAIDGVHSCSLAGRRDRNATHAIVSASGSGRSRSRGSTGALSRLPPTRSNRRRLRRLLVLGKHIAKRRPRGRIRRRRM